MLVIANGPKIPRWQNESKDSPANAFEGRAENNESDVAILGVRAGIRRKGSGEGGSQQVVAGVLLKEQLLISGQACGVGEEHAEGDFAASGVEFATGVGHEFRDDADYRGF